MKHYFCREVSTSCCFSSQNLCLSPFWTQRSTESQVWWCFLPYKTCFFIAEVFYQQGDGLVFLCKDLKDQQNLEFFSFFYLFLCKNCNDKVSCCAYFSIFLQKRKLFCFFSHFPDTSNSFRPLCLKACFSRKDSVIIINVLLTAKRH